MIFEGDTDTYNTAKKASDGLEHGFLDFNKITAHAVKCTDKTFHYIRKTILSLLMLEDDVAAELLNISPRDVQSDRKVIRGQLVGEAEDPSDGKSLYPILEWSSSITSITRDGERFIHNAKEHITVKTHPEVGFRMDSLGVIGRLEAGGATKTLSDDQVAFEEFKNPKGPKLIARAQGLIDTALAAVVEGGYSMPAFLAFQLYSQGVASFQSVAALIAAQQPVEALPSLQTLTIIAGRFEQMAEEDGVGLGLVVRLNIDWLEKLGVSEEVVAERRREIIAGATHAGVTSAESVPDPRDTTVYRGLGAEMRFASDLVNGTYGVLAQHITTNSAGVAGFHTHLEPGPFTDLVASATVIGAMTLLQHGSKVLKWKLNYGPIAALLAEAVALNEEAARDPAT